MPIRRYDNQSLLELNIQAFIDKTFVDMGLYQNVGSGQLRVGGSRVDVLTRKTPRVYESFFNNWVSELDAVGASGFPPVNVSGVTVDGVFVPRGSGVLAPAIDFRNGRVVFASDVAAGSTVEAVFSYKEVHSDFPNTFLAPALNSEFKDNVVSTNVTVPSGLIAQLPIVVIDMQTQGSRPRSLGGGTQKARQVVFHILTNSRRQMNRIVDQLESRSDRKVIQGVDFNLTPTLITSDGDRASTYRTFTDMQGDNALKWERLYIDQARLVENNNVFYGFHRARVDWDLTFYRPPGG